ncbi:MAG: mannose-1-phosphate guanylyltransferase [Clostridia bacterium]|nr:mannose-1-phosphate guanylyltransferase [Clostridia bacterium]
MKTTALIMAGGRGERFWPRSRAKLPKQFISVTGDGKTLIQHAVERISDMVAPEDVFIATGEMYYDIVREQLPDVPPQNILCEPVGRNTAPCIALGAAHIRKKYGDAIMLVLPSDHIIKYTSLFVQQLNDAAAAAEENGNLVTLGITPTYPETGYGYIQFDNAARKGRTYPVKRFVEKPDFETAQRYMESEEYLWNSGMFVWKVSSIMENLRQLMPALYEGTQRIEAAVGTAAEKEVLAREFADFPSTSIDYGVMEKAQNIYTLPGTFGWDDVGSWLALERTQKTNEFGNVISGNVVSVGSKGCILQGGKRLVAAVGISDLIVVDTEDVLLVCEKQSVSDIKKVLDTLRTCNRNEYI